MAGRAACSRRHRAHRRGRTTTPAAVGDGTHGTDHPRSGLAEGGRPRHGLRGGALPTPPKGCSGPRAESHRGRCRPGLDRASRRRHADWRAPRRDRALRRDGDCPAPVRATPTRPRAACRQPVGPRRRRHARPDDAKPFRGSARGHRWVCRATGRPSRQSHLHAGGRSGRDRHLMVRPVGRPVRTGEHRPQRPAPLEHLPHQSRAGEVLRLGGRRGGTSVLEHARGAWIHAVLRPQGRPRRPADSAPEGRLPRGVCSATSRRTPSSSRRSSSPAGWARSPAP